MKRVSDGRPNLFARAKRRLLSSKADYEESSGYGLSHPTVGPTASSEISPQNHCIPASPFSIPGTMFQSEEPPPLHTPGSPHSSSRLPTQDENSPPRKQLFPWRMALPSHQEEDTASILPSPPPVVRRAPVASPWQEGALSRQGLQSLPSFSSWMIDATVATSASHSTRPVDVSDVLENFLSPACRVSDSSITENRCPPSPLDALVADLENDPSTMCMDEDERIRAVPRQNACTGVLTRSRSRSLFQ